VRLVVVVHVVHPLKYHFHRCCTSVYFFRDVAAT